MDLATGGALLGAHGTIEIRCKRLFITFQILAGFRELIAGETAFDI